jgi:hypothetical protein
MWEMMVTKFEEKISEHFKMSPEMAKLNELYEQQYGEDAMEYGEEAEEESFTSSLLDNGEEEDQFDINENVY